jgi:pyridoxamine 5'-phosphate oxidase
VDIASDRRDYDHAKLDEAEAGDDPFALFDRWLTEALAAHVLDATAMTLATATIDGKPSARVVLLKHYDRRGFDFFTRYSTRKGAELEDNPRAALVFHWREQSRQVRIEGTVQRLPRTESEAYFATRPRASQLAARAASGLASIADRAALEQRFAAEARRCSSNESVPMPEDWGGYRTTPIAFEFWQGRPNRLHDRLVYERAEDARWLRHRLAP